MREYELVLDCYRSGQMSERQWQEHLKDEVFDAWLQQNNEAAVRYSPTEYTRLIMMWDNNEIDPEDLLADPAMREWLDKNRHETYLYMLADQHRSMIRSAINGDVRSRENVDRMMFFPRFRAKYERATALSWQQND